MNVVDIKPEGLEKLKWYQFSAFISAFILIISMINPISIQTKYPILISLGILIYSITEWSEWGIESHIVNAGILKFQKKFPNWKSRILKSIAVILIILPLIELFLGQEFIPFPEI